MFPSQALKRFENFSGPAEDLIAAIDQITSSVHLGISPGDANERLIRHYVAVKVLDRPERFGKGVVYGYRHLLQYLVARRLLGNGFQLAKIAEYTGRVPTAALLKSLDGAPQRSEAQLLIEAYGARAEARAEGPAVPSWGKQASVYPAGSRRPKGSPSIQASLTEPPDRGAPSMARSDSTNAAPFPSQPEPVLSMIDLADRFERTSREQRAQFEALSEHLERHLELRLMNLEKRLSVDAMKHGLQGSEDHREQLMRVRDEMQQMYHALQKELHASLREVAAQQQSQSERLLGELVKRLERVLRHQEDTERSLAGLRNDLWALQRAFGSKPPNNKENKQDETKKKEEDGKR